MRMSPSYIFKGLSEGCLGERCLSVKIRPGGDVATTMMLTVTSGSCTSIKKAADLKRRGLLWQNVDGSCLSGAQAGVDPHRYPSSTPSVHSKYDLTLDPSALPRIH